jgi:hypothetical protein
MPNRKSPSKVSDEVFFEPDNLDRDKMFESQDTTDYLWCLHCERAYQRGKFRRNGELQMCPYSGCDGDTVLDGWDWGKLRDAHADYPALPVDGVHYPLYSK